MSKQKIPHFKDFLDECLHERVGQLYERLEKFSEFNQVSAKEDELLNALNNGITDTIKKILHDYCDIVEQKYVLYRYLYYRAGFYDYPKTKNDKEWVIHLCKKQFSSFVEFIDDSTKEKVTQHFKQLEAKEDFKRLSAQEDEIFGTLKHEIPEELLQPLMEFNGIVQQKYSQYSGYYYIAGFRDCVEFVKGASSNESGDLGENS